MKRFTVETIAVTSTRFTGREFRAHLNTEHTDEEIAAAIEQDESYRQMVQRLDGLGTRTTHTETSAYTRTIAPQEDPA